VPGTAIDKIGVTLDLEQRVEQLRKERAYPLAIIYTLKTYAGFWIERRTSTELMAYSLSGDWFLADTDTVLQTVERVLCTRKEKQRRGPRRPKSLVEVEV
jgi:hypothetical protein